MCALATRGVGRFHWTRLAGYSSDLRQRRKSRFELLHFSRHFIPTRKVQVCCRKASSFVTLAIFDIVDIVWYTAIERCFFCSLVLTKAAVNDDDVRPCLG